MRHIFFAAPLAAASVLLPPAQGRAQAFMFETGTTLLEKCQNKAPEYALACTAYIVGVVDGIKKDIFIGRAPANCWPAQMEAQQVRNLVVKYLKAYPDQRKAPASLTISVALNDAYSCQK